MIIFSFMMVWIHTAMKLTQMSSKKKKKLSVGTVTFSFQNAMPLRNATISSVNVGQKVVILEKRRSRTRARMSTVKARSAFAVLKVSFFCVVLFIFWLLH